VEHLRGESLLRLECIVMRARDDHRGDYDQRDRRDAQEDHRRRLYARINAMPSSTVREELLAIAQRHESDER
jgi:hypothetical protein